MSYQHLFFKIKDIVPVQVLNILKEYLLLKLLKLRWCTFLSLFVLNWSIARNRNWAKQSEIDVTMFPEIAFSDMTVEKISIRVLECEVIQVDVTWDTKEAEYIWLWKSAVLWYFSYFGKSMLKSQKKLFLFLWKQIFTKGI